MSSRFTMAMKSALECLLVSPSTLESLRRTFDAFSFPGDAELHATDKRLPVGPVCLHPSPVIGFSRKRQRRSAWNVGMDPPQDGLHDDTDVPRRRHDNGGEWQEDGDGNLHDQVEQGPLRPHAHINDHIRWRWAGLRRLKCKHGRNEVSRLCVHRRSGTPDVPRLGKDELPWPVPKALNRKMAMRRNAKPQPANPRERCVIRPRSAPSPMPGT